MKYRTDKKGITYYANLPAHEIHDGDSIIMEYIKSPLFQNWFNNLDRRFTVTTIEFQSVDYFGPKIGFMKIKADIKDPAGNAVPGIVFLRGGSVALFVVLTCNNEKYVLLTVQPRTPTGSFEFKEIPAGMTDGGSFVGAAAKEIKEETGLEFSVDELTDMTEHTFNDGIFLSPGGSDEIMRFYCVQREVTQEFLNELQGKCTGDLSENEKITLQVVPIADLFQHTRDSKAIIAYWLYQNWWNSRLRCSEISL